MALVSPPGRCPSLRFILILPFSTQNYMDLRVGKSFNVNRQRIAVSLDVVNALNTNVAQALTFVSGPTYGQITQIPAPRILRLGAQYSF